MSDIKEEFKKVILDYIGETPQLVKTGEQGYGWSGAYDIAKWVVSDECEARARTLGEIILGGPGTHLIYRYATGRACPHSIVIEHMLRKLREYNENPGD
jgi:hypothetical protein